MGVVETLIGILLTVGVVSLLITLEILGKKSRREDPISSLESYLRKKGFSVERRETGACSLLLAKKAFRKILMVVGRRVDIDLLKEIFYTSYTEGVSEVNILCPEITKEALEAIKMIEKNKKVHKTKVRYERDVASFRV